MASARTCSPSPRVSNISRSEEHTSELQSHLNLVCRLLLEKKKANDAVRDAAIPHALRTYTAPHARECSAAASPLTTSSPCVSHTTPTCLVCSKMASCPEST